MSSPPPPRIEINGRAATAEQLRFPALTNYGHYTAMQVRNGRVRGLELHLTRLVAATRELFDAELDSTWVRAHLRHALADTPDAAVRVDVFWPDPDDQVAVMVTLRPPVEMPTAAQRLQSMPYQRPLAHLKHVGTFGQIHFGNIAKRNGFDDALLTGAGGMISEGAITNIGFFDGSTVVWPDAPALPGITMQLLGPRLAGSGLLSQHREVRLADLPAFAGAFVTNSRGVAPVGQIDDLALPIDQELMKTVTQIYESVPWDPI